jgi:uncharacterized protein with PIN domain
MIRKITAAYIRKHTDNGQTVAFVEWMDHKGRAGRTEGAVNKRCECCGAKVAHDGLGAHMAALFDYAKRQGVEIKHETW